MADTFEKEGLELQKELKKVDAPTVDNELDSWAIGTQWTPQISKKQNVPNKISERYAKVLNKKNQRADINCSDEEENESDY